MKPTPHHRRRPGLAWAARLCLQVAALVALPVVLLTGIASTQTQPPAVSVSLGPDGRLRYSADPLGNRIVDFSHAGYRGGGVRLPDVPARVVVSPAGRRDRVRIQAAIDLVSSMPLDVNGFRGAVLLEPGRYVIDSDLRIAASGVVLRGAGTGENGSVLVADGTSRRSLIAASGSDTPSRPTVGVSGGVAGETYGRRRPVVDSYVPAGATELNVADAVGLKPGDRVVVRRPSTAPWIALLGMNLFQGWRPENRLHWQPGSRDIEWDRVVTAVRGDRLTIDAPLTTALEERYGGAFVIQIAARSRISEVGVENLRLVSAFDASRPMDEDHSWYAVSLDGVENAWVRRVAALHFVGSVINAGSRTKWLTVEDVDALAPVSELGGFRRRAFHTAGQQTLFRRCRSEKGLHDFVVGFAAAGPNVFLESTAREALEFSGPIESWGSGALYDNVVIRGNALRLTNRGIADQGVGWAAANSVLWNSEATDVEVQSPPGAVNQAYGCKGLVTGDGVVWDPRTMPYRDFYRGSPVAPRSLYLAQLAERLGPTAIEAIAPREVDISSAGVRRLNEEDVAAFEALHPAAAALPIRPLTASDGRFLIGGEPAWKERVTYSWFQAQMPRTLAAAFGPALTRFAPGIIGTGATDDLEEVAARMPPRSAFYQHYGLWYDRRRVDHNYYGSPEQRTGDVWAPFMELPWGRSGQGKAWDGLSKYDLGRFNPWYFERIREFAAIADRRGLVLYHNFYFQHWLLESRSHYVDFPWRPVNAVQATGLPDEVPAASVFYDVSHPLRRDLHRRYIRHALDNLLGRANVVHGIDREYTGPLSFVRFWLDTIAEWERERGTRVFICLEIPKDQMDAILDDPVRGPMIAAADVLGWTYRANGTLFATRGAIDRAPREQRPEIATPEELESLKKKLGVDATDQRDFLNGPEFQRLFDTLWASSKPMKYRAWREYRDAHPDLVLLWNGDEYPLLTAGVERVIPARVRGSTRPADLVRTNRDTAWCMARSGETYLVYSMAGRPVQLDLSRVRGSFSVTWIDGSDGRPRASGRAVSGGGLVTLEPSGAPAGGSWVAWLSRSGS
jgi:hypothetical protein